MTATLLPEGKQSFTDSAGVPLVGGKLYTYATGTLVPQTTWSDAAQTAPNANPIILDGRGEATVYWSGAYKVQLQDSLGNVIWTVDPVTSIPTFNGSLIPAVDNTYDLGSTSFAWRQLYVGASHAPVYDATSGNVGYYKRTDAEIAALVVPVNFWVPSHDVTGGIFLVRRYGTNTVPGTTVMDTAIANAIAVAYAARGGTVQFDPQIHKITANIVAQAYVFLQGAYGESNYPSTLPGGGTANTGTQLLWGGGAGGKMLDVTNVRMFKLDGIDFNGAGNTTVTAIWLDSTNNPSGSQSEFSRFNIRDCFRGVQWGTSGIAAGSYANDGTRFTTFTVWSSVVNSIGWTINSGNAGQMSTIENGGIQVQDLGIDLQACNILRIAQVFGGGQMNSGFIKSAIGIDITIQGCSSECWGPGQTARSDAAYFLKTVQPADAYPMVESTITMIGNQINNPVVLDYPARIVSTGDAWGYCKIIATGLSGPAIATASAAPAYSGAANYVANKHVVSQGGINYLCTANTIGNAPPNVAFWSPTSGKSRVLALNNGRNPSSIDITTGAFSGRPTHGWIDGPYINLDIQDPALSFIQPAYAATYFTTNGAGGWTVDAGDVEYYGYKLNGQTMTIVFRILTSSVVAAVGNELRIAIPAGKIVAQPMCNTVARCLDNGVLSPAFVTADQGNAYIQCQRQDLANFTASANTTQLKGQITFMVN